MPLVSLEMELHPDAIAIRVDPLEVCEPKPSMRGTTPGYPRFRLTESRTMCGFWASGEEIPQVVVLAGSCTGLLWSE